MNRHAADLWMFVFYLWFFIHLPIQTSQLQLLPPHPSPPHSPWPRLERPPPRRSPSPARPRRQTARKDSRTAAARPRPPMTTTQRQVLLLRCTVLLRYYKHFLDCDRKGTHWTESMKNSASSSLSVCLRFDWIAHVSVCLCSLLDLKMPHKAKAHRPHFKFSFFRPFYCRAQSDSSSLFRWEQRFWKRFTSDDKNCILSVCNISWIAPRLDMKALYWFLVNWGVLSVCWHLCGWDQSTWPLTPLWLSHLSLAGSTTVVNPIMDFIPGEAVHHNLPPCLLSALIFHLFLSSSLLISASVSLFSPLFAFSTQHPAFTRLFSESFYGQMYK